MAQLERRLAAVLAIDTVGYSRMMEADGEGTYRRLTALMLGIIEPAITGAGGRIVKKTGDGALVEFPSVSAAIAAGTQIQAEATQSQSDVPAERLARFRIGINLGDVIVDPDDIYGDGVNIAARLESIAQPGDVVVSESAMQTADRVGYSFTDLGIQRLKNISRPVRAYRVVPQAGATGHVDAPLGSVPGFGTRPAIAVLPFVYRGPDSDTQEYLADGVTEDFITALSHWRFFPVIARGSMFAFKGREVDPLEVAQQVGARYVLEGRLRRQGDRIRTGVDLVDADTRETLFSEQYEHGLLDMFAMQDEVVRSTIGALEPELLRREHQRALRTPPQSATAYELFLRGQWHHYRYNKAENQEARDCFQRALELAASYAHASAGLALALTHAGNVGWGEREALHDEALMHARNAVRTDPRDPLGQLALGLVLQNSGFPPAEAAEPLSEAIRLDPSYAGAHANLGMVYNFMNRPHDALPQIELALRLSPHDPRRFIWLPVLIVSHYLSGRYKEALAAAQETLRLKPDFPVPLRHLLATLGQLGRASDAGPLRTLVAKLDGGLGGTEAYFRRMFEKPALDRLMEGLIKAGLT